MAKYILTNKAVNDLSKIWFYTFENWSEKQADKYYQSLINSFEEISENPDKGQNYIEIAKEIKGFKINKHIIFYHINNLNFVEIVRILHQTMDLRNRIKD